MLKNLNLKLEEELINKIKTEANIRGLSQKDLIVKALEHFFVCKKSEETPTLKLIITKYPGYCSKCGRKIDVGEYALYGRTKNGSILICDNCMPIESDKKLLTKHLKIREMNQLIKALKKEIEKYTEKLEDIRILNKYDKLYEDAIKHHKMLMDYLRGWHPQEEEKQLIENMINTQRELMRTIRDIDAFLSSRIKKPIKRRERNR